MEEEVWLHLILLTHSKSVDSGMVAPSPFFSWRLRISVASGVGGDAWRHVDSGSMGNELAANAKALCHVSAKKLVGETQYWKVPHIQVERDDP